MDGKIDYGCQRERAAQDCQSQREVCVYEVFGVYDKGIKKRFMVACTIKLM